jgi:hypothetical protein
MELYSNLYHILQLDSRSQICCSVTPLVLTEVLSHPGLTGAVQVDQVLVVSTSPTSLLSSRESGPFLPNEGSETSSEGLLVRAEPALLPRTAQRRTQPPATGAPSTAELR